MKARSWRWFTTRLYNLLTTPETRLRRVLYPPKDEKGNTPA